ncbi:hypothetical protein M758_10G110400 [Ceratodon purpureus]|nr:hypothetical protein M758_10G110400 [Ceratodon purpureus]
MAIYTVVVPGAPVEEHYHSPGINPRQKPPTVRSGTPSDPTSTAATAQNPGETLRGKARRRSHAATEYMTCSRTPQTPLSPRLRRLHLALFLLRQELQVRHLALRSPCTSVLFSLCFRECFLVLFRGSFGSPRVSFFRACFLALFRGRMVPLGFHFLEPVWSLI